MKAGIALTLGYAIQGGEGSGVISARRAFLGIAQGSRCGGAIRHGQDGRIVERPLRGVARTHDCSWLRGLAGLGGNRLAWGYRDGALRVARAHRPFKHGENRLLVRHAHDELGTLDRSIQIRGADFEAARLATERLDRSAQEVDEWALLGLVADVDEANRRILVDSKNCLVRKGNGGAASLGRANRIALAQSLIQLCRGPARVSAALDFNVSFRAGDSPDDGLTGISCLRSRAKRKNQNASYICPLRKPSAARGETGPKVSHCHAPSFKLQLLRLQLFVVVRLGSMAGCSWHSRWTQRKQKDKLERWGETKRSGHEVIHFAVDTLCWRVTTRVKFFMSIPVPPMCWQHPPRDANTREGRKSATDVKHLGSSHLIYMIKQRWLASW
jgi:hypothetical protein